jgi:hypothetical protein
MRAPQYGRAKRSGKVTPPRETFARVALPRRDKRLSRNDNRIYAWSLGMNKVDNGPRF